MDNFSLLYPEGYDEKKRASHRMKNYDFMKELQLESSLLNVFLTEGLFLQINQRFPYTVPKNVWNPMRILLRNRRSCSGADRIHSGIPSGDSHGQIVEKDGEG